MARPTKLTPEVSDRVLQAIRAGNFQSTAARFAGIDPGAFHRWMRRGEREPRGIYGDFHDRVERALAEAEVRDIAMIERASQSHWQAAAWRLERMHPERWGRKERVEHTGQGGDPISVTMIHRLMEGRGGG